MAPTSPRTPAQGLRLWAELTPEREALSDGRTSLTFAALHEQVEALGERARRSVDASARTSFLPVFVDRSVESCVAVLACLYSQVPFFPIDHASTPELVRSVFERAGSPDRALVPGGLDVDTIPPGVLRIDEDPAAGVGTPGSEVAGDEAAIVVFTSGSTGRPKGVVLDWQAMNERWRLREDFAPDDRSDYRAPLIAPLDSLWGVALLADVACGCSELVVDAARLRPRVLLSRLAEFAPSHVALPSQLARVLAQLPESARVGLPTVRFLAIGSEGFRYEYLAGLRGMFPDSVLVTHSLASTEAGRTLSNTFTLDSAPPSGVVLVGRPVVPDDVRFRPVPGMDDSVSEVLAGGPIAREYLGDPDVTALRFISDDDGRRWWCSGDMVSLASDGQYQHRGRMDDVVKVRGKLASPSEVTGALLRVPGIRSAVVLADVQDSNTRLVAHVEVEDGSDVTLEDVRASLARQLAAHLVPSAIMRHRSLPINVRGKVDRQALSAGPFEPW